MSDNKNPKSSENSKESNEKETDEITTIVFETEAGEIFAEVDLSTEEYELIVETAEKMGMSLQRYIIKTLEDYVKMYEDD